MEKYKIIIVENDEDERFFMAEGFQTCSNFQVLDYASNGEELMELLHQENRILPDFILSDLNMPGKNGYDIITEIKSSPELSHIPVIITSTSSARSIIERCKDLGAFDYLVKPETFNEYDKFAVNLYNQIKGRIAEAGKS